MQHVHELAQAGGSSSVVVIGAFDGLHRGHQALIAQAKKVALQNNLRLVLVTFRPHPVQLLAPKLAPKLLCTPSDMRDLFEASGVDTLVEQPFNKEFSQTEPADFINQIQKFANARHIVIGYDFSFGRNRKGSPQVLQSLAEKQGLQLTVVPPQSVENGLVVSSTKIRAFLLEGRVEAAELALGRPYHLSGQVVHGVARGRTMGFPTANVSPQNELIPEDGVYACWLEAPEIFEVPRMAVTNIGANPTFGDIHDCRIECHIIDCEGPVDLYDARVRVFFARRLRGECRFENMQALMEQIAKDVQQAKETLQSRNPPRWPVSF